MSKMPGKEKKQQNGKDELVLTPGGWRPKSKVHRVAPGHHVEVIDGRLKIVHTATGEVVEDLGETAKAESAESKKGRSETRRTKKGTSKAK